MYSVLTENPILKVTSSIKKKKKKKFKVCLQVFRSTTANVKKKKQQQKKNTGRISEIPFNDVTQLLICSVGNVGTRC